ncbi:hypothetical protein E6C70_15525 [Glaciibacter flavus]|uniref:Uncharacterized protein n=1 Tax=Orlajensenia flava TaxID=2565934 RepID=A0A4S4FJF9_9MICO|nr:hypothetical protein [Glaciibacter flavus]THG30439.1 hypothetical protein E6C70_15525 [Glaciibacter flavus]
MSYGWQYQNMPDSPKGHEIQKVEGNPDAITTRGHAIAGLGLMMQQSAKTLELLAGGQVGKGDSLDSVKDQAKDVHGDLQKAGERYLPSGDILVKYGHALSETQATLDSVVAECEERWLAVKAKAGAADSADTGTPPAPGADDPVKAAEAEITTAYNHWKDEAEKYDGPYETWWDAYDAAVNGLQDVNDDGVSDGFWDNALPFIEGMVTFLEWAGMVLLVAALIIGGPFIAVLAVIVAVFTLIGTIVLYAKGRADGRDLAFAIIGVIPFGKFAKLGKLGTLASDGARFQRLSGFKNLVIGDDLAKISTHLSEIDRIAGANWARALQEGGTPYAQITAGSRLFARIGAIPESLAGFRLTLTKDAFIGRFMGEPEGPWMGLTNVDFGLRFTRGVFDTVFAPADFANTRIEEQQNASTVESWKP